MLTIHISGYFQEDLQYFFKRACLYVVFLQARVRDVVFHQASVGDFFVFLGSVSFRSSSGEA